MKTSLLNNLPKLTSRFSIEALPGLVTTVDKAYNIGPEFKKNENPYSLTTWELKNEF